METKKLLQSYIEQLCDVQSKISDLKDNFEDMNNGAFAPFVHALKEAQFECDEPIRKMESAIDAHSDIGQYSLRK
jgi:hypothetical protein